VEVPLNKSFILLEGEGRVQTFIEWGDHAAAGGNSTSTSPTFTSYATDFMARDISFKVSRPFDLMASFCMLTMNQALHR
jgi:pectinesterase